MTISDKQASAVMTAVAGGEGLTATAEIPYSNAASVAVDEHQFTKDLEYPLHQSFHW